MSQNPCKSIQDVVFSPVPNSQLSTNPECYKKLKIPNPFDYYYALISYI